MSEASMKQNLRDKILEYGRLERVVGRETERYGEASYENVNASLEILGDITRDLDTALRLHPWFALEMNDE